MAQREYYREKQTEYQIQENNTQWNITIFLVLADKKVSIAMVSAIITKPSKPLPVITNFLLVFTHNRFAYKLISVVLLNTTTNVLKNMYYNHYKTTIRIYLISS